MPPLSFNQVLLAELKQLRPRAFQDLTSAEGMVRWGVSNEEWDANRDARARELRQLFTRLGRLKDSEEGQGSLAALCLSGGGIRSATFNLGILQGLAERGLLDRFDYLSSVSGGGYIASWLNAWIHREGREPVLHGLARTAADRRADPLAPEARPLDHLREFSNYLTPRAGLFSPDSWMLAATVLRNVLLNWLVILPLLVAVLWVPLILPRVLELEPPPGALVLLFILSLACGLVASYFAHRYRRLPYRQDVHQWTVVVRTVLPLYLATLLLSWAAAYEPWQDWCCAGLPPLLFGALCALAWTLGVPLLGWWLVGWEKAGSEEPGAGRLGWPVHDLLGLLVSGLVAAGLLLALAQWPAPIATPGARALYPVLALPALLATYVVARSISAAVTNLAVLRRNDADRRLRDHDLEWWARYSGWVLLFAVSWAAVTALCLYGPAALRLLPTWGKTAVAALGGASGLAVRALGRSAATPAGRRTTAGAESPGRGWALALAAPFFIALLIAFAALGVTSLVTWVAEQPNTLHLSEMGPWAAFGGAVIVLSLPVGIFAAAAWLLGLLVNTNDFSLHGMYRNRLVRAYLGASNQRRKPDPFTGFARDDDLPLHELQRDARTGESVRPIPVINVALNLVTTGEKLAWQQRKAESFSMTPLFCGNFHDGYRDTARYGGPGGITLGTAMAISGAAANPNMGYHSSPAITFLLGLFNARLGVWLGNTNSFGDATYTRSGPASAVGPLVAELLGLTSSRG
ncbi:MAG: patatin-like phospholipase family protein, partial [Gemmatimonadales bacterium]